MISRQQYQFLIVKHRFIENTSLRVIERWNGTFISDDIIIMITKQISLKILSFCLTTDSSF